VASKKAKKGDTPALRTARACKVKCPLAALHDEPSAADEATLTITDWLMVPPSPVQDRV
jgi:hypothetical protein